MKTFSALIKSLAFLAVIALLPGCMSNAQFEGSELTTAGFKSITATTPAQIAHLSELPQGKITKVPRNGHTYFVFPDPKHDILYVGRQAQYSAYQKNLAASASRQQFIIQSQNNFVGEDAYLESVSNWGPWEGLSWGY
jgi:hypothetical protein